MTVISIISYSQLPKNILPQAVYLKVWQYNLKSLYTFNLLVVKISYKCSQAASTGSDLELSIEVPDSSGGEKSLYQQQNAKHKESSCKAVDDVLQDVNAVERT